MKRKTAIITKELVYLEESHLKCFRDGKRRIQIKDTSLMNYLIHPITCIKTSKEEVI
jgi:hypothetical protein